MFDARSLLDSIMGGGRQQAPGQQGGGGLGDILGQLQRQLGQQGQGGQGNQGGGGLADILGQLQRQLGDQRGGESNAPASRAPADRDNRGEGGDNALGDLMRNLFPDQGSGGQGRDQGGRQATNQRTNQDNSGQEGGLDDILGQLQRHLGGGAGGANERGRPDAYSNDTYNNDDDSLSGRSNDRGGRAAGNPGGSLGGGGGLFDVLGKVLGQATQGAREGAGRIGEATGANDALGRMTGGRSADDILGQLKQLIENNKLGAGVAAGGLGALVLGTQTGRAVAGSAARIGALALIGGLAYKALQNYQAGRPLITGADPVQPAPQGSGYEADAVDNDTAMLYLQAMLAAAAADGRLDEGEQARILSLLKQAGVESGAEEFIAEDFNNPAEPEALAEAVTTQEQAVQVYTAARLAIDPDTSAERQFLARLAAALNLDSALVAHIDANARSVA